MAITFQSQEIKFKLPEALKIKSWIKTIIRIEKKKMGQLNFVFTNDEALLNTNIQFLNHSTYTDIITFDLSSVKHSINGELYISIDRVKENSKSNFVTISNELHRVIIHGTLHLCGYKDKTPQSKKLMTTKENESLKRLQKSLV